MRRDKLPGPMNAQLAALASGGMVEAIVRVVVPALSEKLKRERRMAEYRRTVEETLAPVAIRIRDLGGDVVAQAWINGTLRAKLPVESVGPLTDEPTVETIELPTKLEAERG